MLNARVPAAGEAMPAATTIPTLAEQIQALRGRSVFHDADGRPLNPAPSQSPKQTFADLEGDVCDLPLSAGVAHQLICGKLFNPINGQDYVSIGRHEREVIEHALFAVENRANELRDKFLAILEDDGGTPAPAVTVPTAKSAAVVGVSLDRNAIADLPLSDLYLLHRMASDYTAVTAAFASQPRSSTEARQDRSVVGLVADTINVLMCQLQDAVVTVARDRTPADESEFEDRAWLLLRDGVYSADTLGEMVALAAELGRGLEVGR